MPRAQRQAPREPSQPAAPGGTAAHSGPVLGGDSSLGSCHFKALLMSLTRKGSLPVAPSLVPSVSTIPTPSHMPRTSAEVPSTFVRRREPTLSAETEAFPRHLWALLAFSGGLGRRRLHRAPIRAALRPRVVARAFHSGYVPAVPHAGPTQLTQVVQAAGDAGQEAELVQETPGLRREDRWWGLGQAPEGRPPRGEQGGQVPPRVPPQRQAVQALPSVPCDSAPGQDAPALPWPCTFTFQPLQGPGQRRALFLPM